MEYQVPNGNTATGSHTIWQQPSTWQPYTETIAVQTYPWWYVSPTPYQTEPTTCIGKAHVFECDHVERCQCGKIQRVLPNASA